MNRKALLLSFFLTLATAAHCLAQSPGKLTVGLVAGPTHTYFRGEEQRNDNESDFRKAAGVSLSYQKSKFFLKSDVLYENKGFVTDYHMVDHTGQFRGTIPFTYNFHYVTVPLLAGLKFDRLGLFFNMGPYLGFLQKLNAVYEYGEYDMTDYWEKSDYGITTGIGYSRTLFSAFQVSAEIRHNKGLKDVDLRELRYRTSSTALLVGVHYILLGK